MTKDHHAPPGSGTFLERPNGTVKAQVQVGGHRLTKTCRNLTEARRWVREQRTNADKGKLPIATSRQKVGDYLSEWLEGKRSSLAPKTWQTYECHLRVHIIPQVGSVNLHRLDAGHLEATYATLADRPRTAAACHRILSQALKHAVKRRLIESNPAELSLAPRYQSPPRSTWTAEQARQFLNSVADEPWSLVYWLLLTTGMRVGELCGLRWGDVDLERRCLTVQRSLQRLHEGITVGRTKTQRERAIILIPEVVERLRAVIGPPDTYVVQEDGKPLEPQRIERDLPRRAKALGLPRVTPHCLRHTCATLLLERGVPVKAVSEILGHSRINITLDLYGHNTTIMQEAAAAAQAEIYRQPEPGCTEDAPAPRLRVLK